jgi:hypothetical protein
MASPWLSKAADEAPERHRRDFDRSLLVARPVLCGAMARLIE